MKLLYLLILNGCLLLCLAQLLLEDFLRQKCFVVMIYRFNLYWKMFCYQISIHHSLFLGGGGEEVGRLLSLEILCKVCGGIKSGSRRNLLNNYFLVITCILACAPNARKTFFYLNEKLIICILPLVCNGCCWRLKWKVDTKF